MTALDLERLRETPLVREPFEFVIVRDFIKADALPELMEAYPKIAQPGSFPLERVEYGETFASLIRELEGPDFRHAVEEKFNTDLEGRPTMITVRGACREKDGQIHTDTESKIITVLLYMNPPWSADGGRLRLLRSPDIEDVIEEVPPDAGTLLMFKRSDNSYHGHHPFKGLRRAVQLNWVTEQKEVDRHLARHNRSSLFKRLNPFSSGSTDQDAAAK